MKRDDKLIKEILLAVRDLKDPKETWMDMVIKGYEHEVISYHVKLLHENGLIEAIDLSHAGGQNWRPKNLTSAGHDYLDEACKPLWKRVSDKALDVSGKILWIFIGSLIGSLGTILANSLINKCN